MKNGMNVEITVNPRPTSMLAMITDYGVVRGGVLRNDPTRLLAWNANRATHQQIIDTLKTEIDFRLVFFETFASLEYECDWNIGRVFEFDGYVFITESHVTAAELSRYSCTSGAKSAGVFYGTGSDSRWGIHFNPEYDTLKNSY